MDSRVRDELASTRRTRRSRSPRRHRRRRSRSSSSYDRPSKSRRRRRSGSYHSRRRDDNENRTSRIVILDIPRELERETLLTNLNDLKCSLHSIRFVSSTDGKTKDAFVELDNILECERFAASCRGSLHLCGLDFTVMTEDAFERKIRDEQHMRRKRASAINVDDPNLFKNSSGDASNYFQGNLPSNVLILKSLDYSATEEEVRNSLIERTMDPIYDVRVIKNRSSGLSRGFCFVEMGSMDEATRLMETINKARPPYYIRERRVFAGYASENPHQNINSSLTKENKFAQDAIAAGQAQSILFQGNVQPAYNKMGDMYYDSNSGYYYDATTGYYYDPSSGYYYNPQSQTYLCFDINANQWLPLNQNTTSAVSDTNQTEETKESAEPSKKEEPESKRIAKNMEKWAKRQNQKSNQRVQQKIKESTQCSASFSDLVQSADQKVRALQNMANSNLIIWEQLICLLCIRKFSSKSILMQHVEISKLHQENLDQYNSRRKM